MYLAGDIGGTKTHLALYEDADNEFKPIKDEVYPSGSHDSLEEIVAKFLEGENHKVAKACFGIAGVVRDGVCHATNLPWVVKAETIKKDLGIEKVALVNDLVSNAFGIEVLKDEDFFVLNEGKPVKNAPQALISAGTGLGEAGLFYNGKTYTPFPCEGGHVDFAPRNPMEMVLLTFYMKKYGHVSYERVLSGPGLENIFNFLVEAQIKVPAFPEEMAGSVLAKKITELALKNECPACKKALDMFVSIYGAAAGNLALKFYSMGGVYIGGGIAPKILSKMQEGRFFEAFIAKGRFQKVLSEMPIKVILNENTALLGSANYAKKHL